MATKQVKTLSAVSMLHGGGTPALLEVLHQGATPTQCFPQACYRKSIGGHVANNGSGTG